MQAEVAECRAAGVAPNSPVGALAPRLRRPTVRVAFLVVGLMLMMLVPGAHALPAASISVNPTTATVGTPLRITGGGWGATAAVTGTITFAGGQILLFCQAGGPGALAGSCTTSAGGNLDVTIDLWWGNAGTANVAVVQGVNTATASFTVSPTFAMSPSSGPVNTVVSVTGTGWSTGGTINRISWDGSGGPLGGSSCNGAGIDAQGNVTCSFTVPSSVAGNHFVTLRDNNGYTATATFITVTDLQLFPATGNVGQGITVVGTGYDNGGNIVSLTWNGAGGLPGDSCTGSGLSGNGGINCGFNVPADPAGIYIVQMTDDAGDTASAPFALAASVSISPGSGFVGSTATVAGDGFSPLTSYQVIWSPTGPNRALLASGTTDPAGSFVVGVTIPADTAGSHTVEGLEVAGHGATDNFQIVPQVLLAPASGPVGTAFSGVGTGFAGSSAITVYWDFGLGDQHTLATGATNTRGGFSFSNGAPPAWNGGHTVTFTPATGPSAGATFTIEASLTLRPFAGAAGSTVLITYAEGLSANAGVALLWDYGLATQRTIFGFGAGITSNATGAVLPAAFGTWTVPVGAYRGVHPVVALDANGVVAPAFFLVGPVLLLVPNAGVVNSTVTALGFNFGPSATVSIFWKGIATALATASANATGVFATTFTVPTRAAGPYPVWANDSAAHSALANFTVEPSLSESATSGPFLSVDTLTYQGMGALSYVQVTWDGGPTGIQQMTNVLGTVVIAFTVPAAPAGAHAISGYDSLGNVPNSVAFTETPKIFPTTTSTYEGNSVSVLLAGFAASNAVTLSWNGLPLFGTTVGTNAQGWGAVAFTVPSTPGVQQLGAYDQAIPPNVAPSVPFNVWALAVPTPVSPLTGSFVNSSGATLVWSPVANANASYTAQVSSSATFGPGTQTYGGLAGTSLGVVLTDGNWYWRVEAVSASGGTAGWSSSERFMVDTQPPRATVLPLPAFETAMSFPVPWSASDPGGSGVAGVWIYWSNSSGTTWSLASTTLITASPFTFSAPGAGTYEFAAVGQDLAGNRGTFPGSEASTIVDPVAPSVAIVLTGPLGTSGWYTGPVTVSLSASPGPSGVREIVDQVGSGAPTIYTGPFSISALGSTLLSAYAVSNSGVQGPSSTVTIEVDAVVPLTTSNVQGGWYTASSVPVTLTAKGGPSGIASTYWSLDGSNWTRGSALLVAGDGVHALRFYSVSGSGLVEPVESQTVRIDSTPPVTAASLSGNLTASGWYATPVALSLSATDNGGSGVDTILYSNASANGPWHVYLTPLTYTTTGATTVYYYGTDLAGNREAVASVTFEIDLSGTVAAFAEPGVPVLSGTVTYTVTLSDPAGLQAAWFQIDGGPQVAMELAPASGTPVTASMSLNTAQYPNGHHLVTVTAVNSLGESRSFSQTVSIDNASLAPIALLAGLVAILAMGLLAMVLHRRGREPSPRGRGSDRTQGARGGSLPTAGDDADGAADTDRPSTAPAASSAPTRPSPSSTVEPEGSGPAAGPEIKGEDASSPAEDA
ncbi:MAG: hypothetical protein KGI98_01360 [Euryarchaeota archaeon]|nr:hypothetical protein [Euryarchaeota archaeon]